MVPHQYPGDLVLAVGERHDAPLGDVHRDGVSEAAGRAVSHGRHCDIVGAVGAEHGAVSHVHPPVAVSRYALGLESEAAVRHEMISLEGRAKCALGRIRLRERNKSCRSEC